MYSLNEFKNSVEHKEAYNAITKHWENILLTFFENNSEDIIIPYYKTSFNNGLSFYDGNPITSAYIPKLNKSIRIIYCNSDEELSHLYGWVTKREHSLEEEVIQELVLNIQSTEESEFLAKYIIKKWIINDYSVKDINYELDKISSILIDNTISNKNWLKELQSDFEVYFIFVESFSQPKTEMRSFKKMFYDKKNQINKDHILECEVDLENNTSRLIAILNVTLDNFEECYNSINSNFFFGILKEKEKNVYINKEELIQELKSLFIKNKENKSLVFNDIKKYLKEGNVLFTIKSNNDYDELTSLHFPNVNFIQ